MNFGETESRVSRPLLSKVEALKAESFYFVRHGSSIIIMSKILSKILNTENIKTGRVSRKISLFWHFSSRFVLKTTETPVFMFSLLRLFDVIIDDPYLTL